MKSIRYAHTNILARDWKTLSQFYIDVFECVPVLPQRDMSGSWIEKMTNIQGVHIEGIHLMLPGNDKGPTLEIFSYNHTLERSSSPQINETGFTHIAFRVDDIRFYIDKVLEFGGSFYGEISEAEIKNVGKLKAVYMRDPERNIVEIQSWE
jgi:predicted enzyme related to lactoylglutathione lyase